MRYHRMKNGSLVDGPGGPRSVLWLQGCSIRCPGCQNPELWPATAGHFAGAYTLAHQFNAFSQGQPWTITGGEPFDQVMALSEFVSVLRKIDNTRNLIVYTGYTVEHLVARWQAANIGNGPKEDAHIAGILCLIDTLVDGPYMRDLDDDHIQWRGSYNQRAINVRVSINAGLLTLDLDQHDCIRLRNWWDEPTLEIVDGRIVTTGGLAEDLDLNGLGMVRPTALCGQAGEVYGEEDIDYRRELTGRRDWTDLISWRML